MSSREEGGFHVCRRRRLPNGVSVRILGGKTDRGDREAHTLLGVGERRASLEQRSVGQTRLCAHPGWPVVVRRVLRRWRGCLRFARGKMFGLLQRGGVWVAPGGTPRCAS